MLLSVGSRRIVIFLAVHTETLSDEIHVDTVDVLNKSRDWREYLLGDVPIDIELNLSFGSEQLVRMISFRRKTTTFLLRLSFLVLQGRFKANDIGDEVSYQISLTFATALKTQCDRNVGQRFEI